MCVLFELNACEVLVTQSRRFVAQVCVGLLAALRLASRWPRFVELGLGLGFRTLFGGNGAVNTKGLVQRVASLTVSLCVLGRDWEGGRNLKLMDGLDQNN